MSVFNMDHKLVRDFLYTCGDVSCQKHFKDNRKFNQLQYNNLNRLSRNLVAEEKNKQGLASVGEKLTVAFLLSSLETAQKWRDHKNSWFL